MLYFIFVIVWLVLWYFIAKEFEKIAEFKGFDGKKYFWWTFWTGIIGTLMVIALPSKEIVTQNDSKALQTVEDDLPDI